MTLMSYTHCASFANPRLPSLQDVITSYGQNTFWDSYHEQRMEITRAVERLIFLIVLIARLIILIAR